MIISGRVQGVGFRASCQREAAALGLTGWVRNRWDGAVEALFEGEAAAVDAMLAWCQDVADAAGGLLGLRSARGLAEVEALRKISAALDIGQARQWRAFLG